MNDIFNLKGKTALITGASQGLGARFAQLLASEGVTVILAARQIHKLNQIAHGIELSGGKALVLALDVTDKTQIKHSITKLLSQKNIHIDILVNNAGLSLLTPIFNNVDNVDNVDNDEAETDKAFEQIMYTNVFGTWFVSCVTANHMKENNICGSIINIASVCGAHKLRSNLTGYCASKSAVIQMTKAMVGELATASIRVNCIIPGLINTPMTDDRVRDKKARKKIENTIPLHFVSEPEDFDGALLYLASNNASRYVTGSCITVDGGASWGGSYDYYIFKGMIY